jgi:hypothetical protein
MLAHFENGRSPPVFSVDDGRMSFFSRHPWRTQIGFVLVIIAGCGGGGGGGGGGGSGGGGGGSLDTVAAFREQYCAIIDPCCAAAGLQMKCAAVVDAASAAAGYYAGAAQACIDGLRARQSSPDFCRSIGSPFEAAPSWYGAAVACERVFSARGTVAPGGACIASSDCAAMPGASARCIEERCIQIRRGKLGDACFGTESAEFGLGVMFATPQSEGALCEHADNLHCDETTFVCAAARALGETCDGTLDCAADAYCPYPTRTCAARLPLGSTCTTDEGACRDPGICSNDSCVAPLLAGAACTNDTVTCASRYCDGTCRDALPLLCAP